MEVDKEMLLKECVQRVNLKLTKIQQAIDAYKADLLSETKSSAGDKHETGRAMLQLEMEKLGQQYQNVLVQKKTLEKLQLPKSTKIVMGSLVVANNIHYFLASSIGQILMVNAAVMVVSVNSPIGKLLLGKQEGDRFSLNNRTFKIEQVL